MNTDEFSVTVASPLNLWMDALALNDHIEESLKLKLIELSQEKILTDLRTQDLNLTHGSPEEELPHEPLEGPAPQADPKIRQLLKGAEDLFGEPVLPIPGQAPSRQLVLAWLAHAWYYQDRLRHPARVIYTNLRDGLYPARRFLDYPASYLPEWFLEKMDLRSGGEPDEDWLEEGEDDQSELVDGLPAEAVLADLSEPEEPVDSRLCVPVKGAGTPSALQAFESLRYLLRQQIHGYAYARWVADLRLVEFEPVSGAFTFLARDAQNRQECAARLTAQMAGLLAGICDRPVEVYFVAPERMGDRE